MENVVKVVEKAKHRSYIVKETANGSRILNPPERRQLRAALKEALKDDLNSALPIDTGEALINSDNLMLLFYNKDDQLVTVEIDIKIKNLDYEPYEEDL